MFSRSLKDVPSGPDRDTAIQKVVNDLKVTESTTVHLMKAATYNKSGAALEVKTKCVCNMNEFLEKLRTMARTAYKKRNDVGSPSKQAARELK